MEIWDLLQKHAQGDLSYQDSVALFFKIYPDRKGLESFFSHQDQHSERKLSAELQVKYQELEANRQQNSYVSVTPTKKNPINVEILPPELRKLHARISPAIREMSALQARLKYCSTDQQRYELADRIVTLAMERRAIYKQLDQFTQTGSYSPPVPSERKTADPREVKDYKAEHDLKLLRSKRTKLKKNPTRFKELAAVEEKIKQLEQARYL